MQKKIIVIGSPGSGKSTFARRLRDITGLPLHYLDMIWHRADETNVSQEEFDNALGEILGWNEWIIDGCYLRTLRERLEKCGGVYLLDYPVEVCLEGAISRVGKRREDMPWVEKKFDEEFGQYIEAFPKTKLPEIYSLLNEFNDKEIYIFKSRDEADEYLNAQEGNH